ncbi:MAG: hypothetical protein ACI8QZ_000587 [Chlamydiales bacterium]|jgi:hypothetical protein
MRWIQCIILVLTIPLMGCSSLHRVSADEFIEMAHRDPTTFCHTSYIGYSRHWLCVYLVASGAWWSCSSNGVYWAMLSEFSDDDVAVVLSGGDPFSPRPHGSDPPGRTLNELFD